MALSTRIRRALGRPSSDSSSSSSTSTSQTDLSSSPTSPLSPTLTNTPQITLTKTTSRLQKITSWRKEKKYVEPKSKYPAANAKYAAMLGGWEMNFGRGSVDGRSVWSGVSPMGSRCVSVEIERPQVEEVERVEAAA